MLLTLKPAAADARSAPQRRLLSSAPISVLRASMSCASTPHHRVAPSRRCWSNRRKITHIRYLGVIAECVLLLSSLRWLQHDLINRSVQASQWTSLARLLVVAVLLLGTSVGSRTVFSGVLLEEGLPYLAEERRGRLAGGGPAALANKLRSCDAKLGPAKGDNLRPTEDGQELSHAEDCARHLLNRLYCMELKIFCT